MDAQFQAVNESPSMEFVEQPQVQYIPPPPVPPTINPETGFLSDDVINRKSHTPLPFTVRMNEALKATRRRKKTKTPVQELPRELYPPPELVNSRPTTPIQPPEEFRIIETFPPKTPPRSKERPHMFSNEMEEEAVPSTPRKRGRPPSNNSTPERSTSSTAKKNAPNLKARRVKQIKEYIKLYPEIQEDLPYDWESQTEKHLDDIFLRCRIRATEGMEFNMVCAVFFRALASIEDITRFLVSMNALPKDFFMIKVITSLPSGSISKYIEWQVQTQHPDSGYLELREIAIDFLGYFPQNPYIRLAMKVGYKIYDYIQFEGNQHLKNISDNFKKASQTHGTIPPHLLKKLEADNEDEGYFY